MRTRILKTLIVVAALILIVRADMVAQNRARTPNPASPGLLTTLPESDAVAQVQLKRLLNDLMPRVLANSPNKLAELNANIDNFKTRTGLDPRQFEQIAFGIRYTYPSENTTKLVTAAVAKGNFSAGAMIAAGRFAADGKYREEKYQGKSIFVFTLDEQLKLFGVINLRIRELAASPIDANTLALGDPTSIRSVIDAAEGRNQNNLQLIALANSDPNAIVGFGGNITPQVIKNLDVGNASFAGDLSGLRQAYGSINATDKDINLFLGAKTADADSAKNLGDTLEGLKQFGALFIGRLTGAKGTLAKSALTNLKINTEANELKIRTAVAQADIGPVVGN